MILVLGAGVAGMSCALAAVREGAHVKLVTPGRFSGGIGTEARALAGGNTALAQGGIAAALGLGDSAASHAADTVAAGAGLVDLPAAGVLAAEGVEAVRGLLAAGFAVDREDNGAPRLGLEGAHGFSRIVHAGGDRTGAILHAFLTAQVFEAAAAGQIELLEECRAVSLVKRDGVAVGAELQALGGFGAPALPETHTADAVVLATGGYAALYPRTSNHAGARGEGIVLAARAGALVADLEFVQFHPTVLAGTGDLISEAVRGAGAQLLDGAGRRFMPELHPRAELAPRDVVSREIHRVLQDRGESSVWLDATGVEAAGGSGSLQLRFPGISAAVAAQGFDWAREPIPVSPAAHYTMGGILSDLDGRSSLPGLYVVGEAATTGVHGGNRLASNSLLEGLVFGTRAGRAASRALRGPGEFQGVEPVEMVLPLVERAGEVTPVERACERCAERGASRVEVSKPREAHLASTLTNTLGIERDASGLAEAARVIAQHTGVDAELAAMIHAAASARTESRGAHQRSDFPLSDPTQATRRAFRFVSVPTDLSESARTLRSLSSC